MTPNAPTPKGEPTAAPIQRFAEIRQIPVYAPTGDGGCTCGNPECGSPGKHPILPWTEATTDPWQIIEWETRYEGCNFGVILRPEYCVAVIDIDPRNGGMETVRQNGWTFPETPTVYTGGGGKHYYYRTEKPIASNAVLGPGVELKVNGLLVVPNSKHASGKCYEWDSGCGPDTPFALLPDWVLQALERKDGTYAAVHHANGAVVKTQQGELRNQNGIPADRMERIPQGNRNKTLTSIAGRLRRNGLDREGIEKELLRINQERCDPPLPNREVETIAKSIAKYPAGTVEPVESVSGTESLQKDYGHAVVLSELFRNRYRWALHRGCWMRWDGKRWNPEPEEAVAHGATETLRTHYAGLLLIAKSDREIRDLTKKINETCDYSRIKGALSFLKGWSHILTHANEWDTDPWLLNVDNGTLNLRTGTLRPHDPADLITKLAPVTFDPQATGVIWEMHVSRFLPNPNIRRQVQRDLGRALPGAVLEESLPIWFGGGANGKTTTAKVLRKLLGDYAGQAAPDLLVQSKYERHPTEKAALCGLRLVLSVEIDQGKKLAESLVKQLTGGDEISARFMRQDFFEFEPTFSIILICNHKPVITGGDDGIWRRIRLIPWEYSIPLEKRHPQDVVVAALLEEGPAILNWLLAGLKDWQQDPHWVADEVRAASEAYRAEMDVLGEFLRDRCELGPRFSIPKGELYEAYTAWCNENHERPLSKKEFTSRLRDKGIGEMRNTKARYYIGVRLMTYDT